MALHGKRAKLINQADVSGKPAKQLHLGVGPYFTDALAQHMKRMIILIPVILPLMACGPGSTPLTESECEALTNKSIEFTVEEAATDPNANPQEIRTRLKRYSAKAIEICVATPSYTREEYACYMRAKDPSESKACANRFQYRHRG